jgi:hypothetical protein
MTPVTIDGCFGWLHEPRGQVGRVGVLICPGLMLDAIRSHCSLRLLGDQLAEAGAALRLSGHWRFRAGRRC